MLEPGGGLPHVDQLASKLPVSGRERYGDRLLGAALGGLWVFIVKAGTGGAMFRSLQAGFLRESADLLAMPASPAPRTSTSSWPRSGWRSRLRGRRATAVPRQRTRLGSRTSRRSLASARRRRDDGGMPQ